MRKIDKRVKLVAVKPFIICHNDYFRLIKVGDDLSDVPEKYLQNLKTEKVIQP
ncbi:hypothetical protein Bb109J_c1957 [Bdellovibrio bacteriovorus]|uniref:hypothetical protein n=1 Tax=Bdellovibrio bacteriovorus TaxID=959 RepID=UPI000B29EE2F|nr:hypothetical protein [Bdellovibrio bacteriovorus]BEV68537.1 hypothetical protein Bb109J_c1957 [Bdellovibrio bacteriovorus]